ncbi:sterol desaturase family protein [Ichthyenterobacterium magnum]|uniref:Sterol desaturase/sphingolipid hydroxylase (Fatty acid hydroxylase superfamily) n=1 Tax=Ichthyenterobacterium magnum TaxID=1230530 RepID=A0A420DVA5_9FLAO|nr:sterol desaturase family protein [Ichthyenterobacterium magnum]RKE98129.1 sterol desaturase/sphingolipid hydroxylase (fatty acid hydroxylase superfamily) [Ichthyenterobacterium magnum]
MQSILSELPTPLELLLDPLSLCVLVSYVILILWEELFPARQLPKVKFWRIKGLVFFFAFFFIASYLPIFIDPYLLKFQVFDLSQLGVLTSSLIGLIVYELVIYAYHITMHKYDFLWRTFHQVHHSAERLDAYGSLFHSPLDMIGFTLVGSVSFALLIGLPPQSVTILLFVVNFLAFFQHANIKTPRWIGYIVQRPESHSIHHGKGIHRNNYADLPLIDMVFGTFENPKHYQKETGFYDGASSRLKDMFLFRDVSKKSK